MYSNVDHYLTCIILKVLSLVLQCSHVFNIIQTWEFRLHVLFQLFVKLTSEM